VAVREWRVGERPAPARSGSGHRWRGCVRRGGRAPGAAARAAAWERCPVTARATTTG